MSKQKASNLSATQSSSHKPHLIYLIRQTVGGMQNHLLALVRHFKHKYKVTVIMPPNKQLEERLNQQNVPFYLVKITDSLNPVRDLLAVFQLRQLLRQLQPALVHIHGNKTALVGRLALLGQDLPTVVTVHNFLIFQKAFFPLKQLAAAVERWLAKKTTCLITVSQQLKEALVKDEGLPAEKIKVIHNGVDVNSWPVLSKQLCRSQFGLTPDEFVILTVGRLVEWKGQAFLIKALNLLPASEQKNLKLLIAGDGPLTKELKQLVARVKLNDRIYFLGHVQNVPELMAAADLFVLPSLNEPFGLVLLEAMAAKVPLIATASGGVPEIVTHAQNGWLVKPADATALAEAIVRLKNDVRLRQQLSRQGWHEVQNRFSLQKMLAETERVYQQCLS